MNRRELSGNKINTIEKTKDLREDFVKNKDTWFPGTQFELDKIFLVNIQKYYNSTYYISVN